MGTTLHELTPPAGARRRRKRVGRGIGSRRGKTSTRGSKGQLARHNGMRAGFEGGQNPLQRRVPKRGFTNINRVEVYGLNVGRLEGHFVAGSEVDVDALHGKGLVPKRADCVKLLAGGDLTTPLKLRLHRASPAARAKVEAVGGSVDLLEVADSAAAGG